MALLPRSANPSRSSSFHVPRYIPLLLFSSLFIFLILYNVDNFVSRTKQIVRDDELLRQETPKKEEKVRYGPREIRGGPQQKEETIREEEKSELGPMEREFEVTWGDGRAEFHDNGTLLTLTLDERSGSGFRSKDEYMFGKVEMQIKLVVGNSAGTVTTYYLTSPEGPDHDEIDFEFLGNSSGDPYTLHTNVYCDGKGNREEQFYLWFDPTLDFHTYTILWNPERIVFSVDGIPIREFKNSRDIGVPFPSHRPMKVYSSLWNADEWATQGGRVKTDWSKAPFVASYRNYKVEACFWADGKSSCDMNSPSSWFKEKVDSKGLEKIKWVQKNHRVYNYCVDKWRFPEGLPLECKFSKSS